ncbi:hypothetical protein BEL04_03300 [Mucilaginibacter sp. PPCGB 2223]|nr:hypothetical protein BEL04_03300 [Mucilaginibacter sp. PPCGB 2223]
MNDTRKQNYQIVGYNLLAVIIYTVLCKITSPKDGWGILMLLIGMHVFGCMVWGIVSAFIERYKKSCGFWFLSAILVLAIGFSTCISAFIIQI